MASSEAGVVVDTLSFVQILCTAHMRYWTVRVQKVILHLNCLVDNYISGGYHVWMKECMKGQKESLMCGVQWWISLRKAMANNAHLSHEIWDLKGHVAALPWQDPGALSFSPHFQAKDFLLRCAKGGHFLALDFADRGRVRVIKVTWTRMESKQFHRKVWSFLMFF